MINPKRHICIIHRNLEEISGEFGGSIRLRTLSYLIEAAGLDYCYIPAKQYLFARHQHSELICVSSFVNMWIIPIGLYRKQFIWLDCMDSIKLTINWQIRSFRLLNLFRAIRNTALLPLLKYADMLSYVNIRDAIADKQDQEAIIFGLAIQKIESDCNYRPRFVMMGDWSYYPNRVALELFLKKIWSNGIFSMGEVPLEIYGKNLPRKAYGKKNLRWKGLVSEFELYGNGAIFLSPISIGSGTKTKTLFPLIANRIVISFPEGAVGISEHPNLHIALDWDEFSAKMGEFLLMWPDPKVNLGEFALIPDLVVNTVREKLTNN